MRKITRNLKSISGALFMLAIMLIALFFVLNEVAKRNVPIASNIASWAEARANGSAYTANGGGGATPVVGVPSSYGPAI